MTILTDLQHNVLVDELQDRGFTVLTKDASTYLTETIDGALALTAVIVELRDALMANNIALSQYLTQKIIFATTGDLISYKQAA